jgi:hypothetical protein
MTVMAKGSYEIYKHQCDLYNLRSWTHGPLKKSPINPLTQINQSNKLKAQRRCALPFRPRSQPSFFPQPSLLAPRPAAAAAAMQAAAARARRVLASPAASGLPGILWGSASGAEGALLLHLHGVPSSASSPHRARGFSSRFAPQSPGELYYLESLNSVIRSSWSRCAGRLGLPGAGISSNWS